MARFCTLESKTPNTIITQYQVIRGAISSRIWDVTAAWGILHRQQCFCLILLHKPRQGACCLCAPLFSPLHYLSCYPLLGFVTRGALQKQKRDAFYKWCILHPTFRSQVFTKEFPQCLAAAMTSQSQEFVTSQACERADANFASLRASQPHTSQH